MSIRKWTEEFSIFYMNDFSLIHENFSSIKQHSFVIRKLKVRGPKIVLSYLKDLIELWKMLKTELWFFENRDSPVHAKT